VEILEVWPAALYVGAALLGLVVGSFLNVVAHRVPIMMERAWREQCIELAAENAPDGTSGKLNPMSRATEAAVGHSPPLEESGAREPLVNAGAAGPEGTAAAGRYDLLWPPSTCPNCANRIAARHNIPVLSYLLLRGRCAACKAKISARYPIVEAAAAVLAVLVAYAFGPTWQTVAALGFTWTLLALSLIDIDHTLLPDSMTLPLVWAGVLLAALPIDATPAADLESSVFGAVAGYLSLWLVYHLFKLVTGKEGMGYGDFKLLAAIVAWLGWQMLPLVILLSAAVGAVVGIAMVVFGGRSRSTPIPFGPYLAGAGGIALLWGPSLVTLYQRALF
jgi:leader peptidase (prepilin peptidase)/N-methyltransferase